jgi:hypothetical protein
MRLVLLLLAMLGVFGVAPVAPARAHVVVAHHAAMPGGCHDEGQAPGHVCVGCAVAPDDCALATSPVASVLAPRTAVPVALVGRRLGFDPPPPRAA